MWLMNSLQEVCVVLFSTVFILGCLGTWGSSDDVMCDVMVSTFDTFVMVGSG